MPTLLFGPLTALERFLWLGFRVLFGLALLAICFLAGAALAQEPGATPAAQSSLVALLNSPGLIAVAGMLIIGAVSVHHTLQIGSKLRADAAKREADAASKGQPVPLVAKLERGGATADDLLDVFLEANKTDEKALADPSTRAAALEHLRAAGVKAIEDRLSGDAAPTTAQAAKAAAPLLLLLLGTSLVLSNCAHAAEPMLLTRDTIVLTDKTFLATQVLMDGLKPELSEQVWQSWLLFEMRFATSFHAARVLYDDAELAAAKAVLADGGTDAISTADLAAAKQVIDTFVSQLTYWQGVVAQLSHPDGGVL